MSLTRTPSTASSSSGTASPPCELASFSAQGQHSFVGLETWDDPTPRPSQFTLEDLIDTCVANAKRQLRLREKSPSREERIRRRQEHDRKCLVIALNVYAKQENMQPSEVELVEVKERNLVDEYGKGYVHFNFLVKASDEALRLFFAEVHPDCRGEEDVYLCSPLEDDSGHCFGCSDRAKGLMHPTNGGYLGGHKDVGFPFMEERDSDEEREDDN